METIITAVGPDNVGLADPIVHFVTGQGANISEIQMYNHDDEAVFAMLTRIELPDGKVPGSCATPWSTSDGRTNLSIRVWSPELRADVPAAGTVGHPPYRTALGAAASDPRRPDQSRGRGDDRQPSDLPRDRRTVWRRLAHAGQ